MYCERHYRLLVLQTVHENLTLLRNNNMETLTFYKLNNVPISNKTENELYDLIKAHEHRVEKITVSIPTSIESLIYFSLLNVFENNLILKVCKNCNNYFFANNSIKYSILSKAASLIIAVSKLLSIKIGLSVSLSL